MFVFAANNIKSIVIKYKFEAVEFISLKKINVPSHRDSVELQKTYFSLGRLACV